MELSTELLADYALDVSYEDFPAEVVKSAKRLLIDSLGIAVGSYTTPPIKALRKQFGRISSAENEATILGTDNTSEVGYAGLINSSMVRYMDFNDTYIGGLGGCHPSDHIGSLLSVAEAEERSGRDLIEAIVIAYEIQARGVDTAEMWGHGFDYSVWGVYAHAAAAGKMMGLTKEQLRNAIGIAATSSNGIMAARMGEVSMWKGIAQPYAQYNALQACILADGGITGPTDVFEVPEGGVFDAITDGSVEFDGLGGRNDSYKILESAIKSYTCGYGAHPAVKGILELKRSHELDPDDIVSIDVRAVPSLAKVYATPERWDPNQSRESADHSIPYCIAVALIDGEVTPRQFTENRLRDERVHDLMEKISVDHDDDLQLEFNEDPSRIPTHIEIEMKEQSFSLQPATAPGHPDDPLSNTQLEEKFEKLSEPFITEEQRDTVLEYCYDLENLTNVGEIPEMLII